MPLDLNWLDVVTRRRDLADAETFDLDGVEIDLPRSNARGRDRVRDWQRRVLADVIPDSVQADAPERTPFRLLSQLTTSMRTERSLKEVFASEFAPLDDLFRAETREGRKMTLAFHVLAVKAAEKGEIEARGFTERTLQLLCRDEAGSLDEALLRELIERFRLEPAQLDLAQKTVLERVQPNWSSSQEPTFTPPEAAATLEVPFDPSAARLFREDIRRLLDAKLPPSDFFQQLNLLFCVHLGLYQPRVAALLNPQMDALFEVMAQPNPGALARLDERIKAFGKRHPFTATLRCRAPDPEHRTVTLLTPERVAFEELGKGLAAFHFNVLCLGQLRRLGEAWFASRWDQHSAWRGGHLDRGTERELAQKVRGPREFIAEMEQEPDFATFLHRATTVLAVRYLRTQIADTSRDEAMEKDVRPAPSGLHALHRLYVRYNLQNSKNASSSRAMHQGVKITSGLLNQGEYGLVQSRPRVGPFFQVGAGIFPLLVLLVVGPHREKARMEEFWGRLEGYGLMFDPPERERFLARLRAMGVYERFSDAGEAAYVRNLMTGTVD
jgi:hypothetical protein